MPDIAPKRRISSRVAYQNPWITIREDTTVSLDGNEGIYAYLESNDSVMVLARNDEGALYMVRGFRYPSNSFGWELPGGGGDGEDAIESAKRELQEETGITARTWEHLGKALVCNGLMSEHMNVCLATGLTFGNQTEHGDEIFGDSKFFTLDQIAVMITEGKINDCQTITGLHYYQLWAQRQETV